MNERFFEVNMSRLTFEIHDEGLFVKESDVKTCDVEDEIMHTGNAIRKLAKYEQAEDDGLLLRLPCKVGDTVYYFKGAYYRSNPKNWEIKPIKVTEFSIKINRSGKVLPFSLIANGTRYRISSIGKTIFLTREEAERALKEAQKNENWQ